MTWRPFAVMLLVALAAFARVASGSGASSGFPTGDVERLAQHGAGAKAWEARFARDAMGLEVDRQLPGGARSYWWRDALGRPTQHWVGQGKALARGRRYAWDVGDRLASITEEGVGTVEFGHDGRGALAKVEHSGGRVEHRAPDDVGNLFATLGRTDREYGRAGEIRKRTTDAGVVTYAYDAEGNLQRRVDPDGGEWAYHFSDAGNLRQVDRPDGTAVVMAYDAFGRRVWKSHGGVKTRFVWDGDVVLHEWRTRDEEVWLRERTAEEKARAAFLETSKARLQAMFPGAWEERWTAMLADDRGLPRLHAELRQYEAEGLPQPPDSVDETVVTWLHDPDGFAPAARLTSSDAHAIVPDHLGAPLSVLDDAGQAVAQVTLDAYGQATIDGEAELVPHRFPGQWHDPETGLHYNRFRHYDPQTGQYLSRDPIGLRGGLRAYAYVADPTTWADPLGLAGKPAAGSGCETWSFDSEVDARVKTHDEAVAEAFRRTGVPLEEFEVTQWGKTAQGKTIPVEWSVRRGPNRGAQVNMDDPTIVPSREGPQAPHVGYQSPGKRRGGGAVRGHIFPESGVLASRGGLEG